MSGLRRGAAPPRSPTQECVRWSHRLGTGTTVHVSSESDWYVYNEIFVDKEYDAPIEAAIADAARGLVTVVDLGANVGFFALRVIDLWRRSAAEGRLHLILVEGSPTVHAQLTDNLAAQELGDVRLEVAYGLVGARSGSATLSEIPFGARNTLFAEHNAGIMPVESMRKVEVPFVDLDELIGQARIDLLKCDVEGAEGLVARTYADSLLSRCRRAVFELHPHVCSAPEFLQDIARSGLRVVRGGDDPQTHLVECVR